MTRTMKIPKPTITQIIEKFCNFICKDFGQRALSFHLTPYTIEQILGRKLTPKTIDIICQKMLNHGYLCIPRQMSMSFFHFSILNSLRFMDEDIMDDWNHYDEEDELIIETYKLH